MAGGIIVNVTTTSNTELIDINGSCTTTLPDYTESGGLESGTGLYIDNKIVICGGKNVK